MDLPEYALWGESGSRREILSEAIFSSIEDRCCDDEESVCLGRKEERSRRSI